MLRTHVLLAEDTIDTTPWITQLNTTFDVQLPHDCNEVLALVVRANTKVDAQFLDRFQQLKFLVTATSGFDHVDIKSCLERGIQVAHCPLSHTESTAQLTLWHILQVLRFAPNGHRSIYAWRPPSRGHHISDMNMGIVGLGRIGERVAELLSVFPAKISFFDPYHSTATLIPKSWQKSSTLEGLLQNCDLISLHCPLTIKTQMLINETTLHQMKKGSFIVNCARGPLVDEAALLQAINTGHIGGYAADVLNTEPITNPHSMTNHPSVFFTPHIGAYTEEAFAAALLEARANLDAMSQGVCKSLIPDSLIWRSDLSL